MRIIGGRDYYDGAGYGFDPTITFVRKAAVTDASTSPLLYSLRRTAHGTIHRFDVVLAGEVTRGLFIETTSSLYSSNTRKIIYDPAEATTFGLNNLSSYDRKICDLSVEPARRDAVREWALNTKTVCAISGAEPREVSEFNARGYDLFNCWNRKDWIVSNGDFLKDVHFYRVMQPAEAHRAISSWVGGVLPYNAPTVEISDRSKIQKAGFDLRTSFRKMKA